MQHDKVFLAYATTLVLGMAAIMVLVVTRGSVEYPSMGFLVAHIVLTLMVRGAYKSWDGKRGFE